MIQSDLITCKAEVQVYKTDNFPHFQPSNLFILFNVLVNGVSA